MGLSRVSTAAALAAFLVACGHVQNLPINQPVSDPDAGLSGFELGHVSEASEDDLLVGLAFSGGGTRAAAFSFGVLKELANARVSVRGKRVPLLERLDFISGVSGGAVTAAYYGLKRRAALDDFRERFLIKDAEEELRTSVSIANLSRALEGGINEDTRLRTWLDVNLFEGATFAALLTERRPRIWINATDIYNGTPFVFGKTAFSAICSDLARYPIASAVAASSAVPLAFSPIVLQAYPDRCRAPLPAWIERARNNPNAAPLLRAFAQGIGRYADGTVKYIKLLDGGLVDNFGLSGFTIARESAETPYGPLTQIQAARLRRILFLVVDAGQAPQRLGAEPRRAAGRRTGERRHGGRALCQRPLELCGLRGQHGELARRAHPLALFASRRAGPEAAGLDQGRQLPRSQGLYRARRLRSARSRPRRFPWPGADPAQTADRVGRRLDRGRR